MLHPALRFRSGAPPSMLVKGVPMKSMFDDTYVDLIAESVSMALASMSAGGPPAGERKRRGVGRAPPPVFDAAAFVADAKASLETLELKPRARHIATTLKRHIKLDTGEALQLLVRSMAPLQNTETHRAVSAATLNGFYYFAHSEFIALAASDITNAQDEAEVVVVLPGGDVKKRPRDDDVDAARPRAANRRSKSAITGTGAVAPALTASAASLLNVALQANYELTQRFSAEFSIRPYLERFTEPTVMALRQWVHDPNPNVRRLVSEGTRSRLPWGTRLTVFDTDRTVVFQLLELLRLDPSRYVTRSVANHLGDAAKDDLPAVLALCKRWLRDAQALPDGPSGTNPDGRYLCDARELKWVIRHALRHPAGTKNIKAAVALRRAAE